ncbi:hypothetical protein H6P81_005642 [Aristolochia fimbriata]|uniref:Beta-galactosidase n=1 Tax=Aristolochia fimbriata TaxID=158543 RepID=A0AAV7EV77_ARIFI|nr:hypothetical protein H6P81_005642 [Aristolochia fimbriata]
MLAWKESNRNGTSKTLRVILKDKICSSCLDRKESIRVMETRQSIAWAILTILVFEGHICNRGSAVTVSYDHRALVIDGQRRVLLSGSIHYPRTTPDVWPDIIRKSKEGGLDVIETYVFWNYHEPVRGQYYFEGRFDLVRFVKTAQEAGMFVHLRIGPYACAEWNYGGFPLWLHFISGIQFRTTNAPFKIEMQRFLAKIVTMMKEENLFAPQGGPIILTQVENEYGNVEWAYGTGGELYVKWAAETAVRLNTSVPWVMCQQEDVPDPVINTCNGFYCDQFMPNSPSKPKMWTENYSGWFSAFGYAVPYRPVEDLAFSVARFIETGGTFQNYYMYFGGTNFGRTAGGPFIATSYDYDAPIDEYGFLRQPKWGHLRDLHKAIKLCEKYLVNTDPTYMYLGKHLEAHIYHKASEGCAAFLANIDQKADANVVFNGKSYNLPAWSVSILPDCQNVIFNTAKVVSQASNEDLSHEHNVTAEYPVGSSWNWYKEPVGIWSNNSFTANSLLEQINTTKDASDFLWYTMRIDLNEQLSLDNKSEVYLHFESLGHAALIFVNKKLTGMGYGNHDDASFIFHERIMLNQGNNTVDLLSMMIGIQNYGPWFDVAGAGIFSVGLIGLGNGLGDLSNAEWTYQVGLQGEYLGLHKTDLANSSLWTPGNVVPINQSLIWYKTTFVAPEGTGPLALNLASMGKGQAWVNGQSIGRYWPAYLSPTTGCTKHCNYRGTYDSFKCLKKCGQPAQTLYHVPRSWVHAGQNLLVFHEELGGDPSQISISTIKGQVACAHLSESDPPPVDSWELNFTGNLGPRIKLHCDVGWQVVSVNFASFGTPEGECGRYSHGYCKADNVFPIVQEACLARRNCSIPVSTRTFGDPCPGVSKSLAVQVLCGP